MQRIHFDKRGKVNYHYPFWQPWGCMGCLGRAVGFFILLALFLFLLSQFRSCNREGSNSNNTVGDDEYIEEVTPIVPPIDDRNVIEDDGREIVDNRLNVLFKAQVGVGDIDRWVQKFHQLYPADNYSVIFRDDNTKLIALEVPAQERRSIMEALPRQIPDIPFIVFEEEVMNMSLRPNDSAIGQDATWYLEAIKAYDAWDISQGEPLITVAVVDSYFDLSNSEFADTEIVAPYSVERGTAEMSLPIDYNPANPDPVIAHGTMVSSLIFAKANNSLGTAGIAPRCRFMPVSLGGRFGCLAMLQGLLYAINHRAQVVNISAGLSFAQEVQGWSEEQQIDASRRLLLSQETVWKYVFDMCQEHYVTIVWAAGNENLFTALDASKRGDKTIKVSSTDKNSNRADFSNFGNFPNLNIEESTVSAPGVQVYGQVPGSNASMPVDGTSFSAPIVAGVVGLMKSLDMSLTTTEIIDILQSTGRRTSDSKIGPVVQAAPALNKVADGFLDYDTLVSIATGNTRPYDKVFPTTLLRPLSFQADEDTTALKPMVQLSFRFAGGNRGKVYYTAVDAQSTPWTADIKVSYDRAGDRVIIVQDDDAVRDGMNPFLPAQFTVVKDLNNKAMIDTIISESVPPKFKPFIKKSI